MGPLGDLLWNAGAVHLAYFLLLITQELFGIVGM